MDIQLKNTCEPKQVKKFNRISSVHFQGQKLNVLFNDTDLMQIPEIKERVKMNLRDAAPH